MKTPAQILAEGIARLRLNRERREAGDATGVGSPCGIPDGLYRVRDGVMRPVEPGAARAVYDYEKMMAEQAR